MHFIHRAGRLCGIVSNHLIGWLLLISVVLNVLQVFTRYGLNDPLFWTEEMIRYTTVWLTFAGAAAASLYGDHMDMNLFLEVRSARFQAWHQAFLHLIGEPPASVSDWRSAGIYLNPRGLRTTALNPCG